MRPASCNICCYKNGRILIWYQADGPSQIWIFATSDFPTHFTEKLAPKTIWDRNEELADRFLHHISLQCNQWNDNKSPFLL